MCGGRGGGLHMCQREVLTDAAQCLPKPRRGRLPRHFHPAILRWSILFFGCLQFEMFSGGLKAPAESGTQLRQRICNAESFSHTLGSSFRVSGCYTVSMPSPCPQQTGEMQNGGGLDRIVAIMSRFIYFKWKTAWRTASLHSTWL